MLLGVLLKVGQAYHSHLRTLTSFPERRAASERQHRTEKSTISTETFFGIELFHHTQGPNGKISTQNVKLQHPEDPFTGAVLTQRDLGSYFFSGLTAARCRSGPGPTAAGAEHNFWLKTSTSTHLWRLTKKSPQVMQTEAVKSQLKRKKKEKMPETHTDKPHIRARVGFLYSVRKRAGLCCRAAFVPVRIGPSCSRYENQRRWMWPKGNLCFYCVYTSWKCADGDCG